MKEANDREPIKNMSKQMKSYAALEAIELTIGNQYMVMEHYYANKKAITENLLKSVLVDNVKGLVTQDWGAVQEEIDDRLPMKLMGI